MSKPLLTSVLSSSSLFLHYISRYHLATDDSKHTVVHNRRNGRAALGGSGISAIIES